MMEIKRDIISLFEGFEFINKIYLFGSRVNNPDKQKGDIDLCFVVDDESNPEQIIEKAAHILVKTNIIVHPVIFKKSEFEIKMNISNYKKTILDNGKLVYSNKLTKSNIRKNQ